MSDTPPPELVVNKVGTALALELGHTMLNPRDGIPGPNTARIARKVLAALAEWADGALIDPKTWTLWDAEYEDIGPSLALVLSPREGEHERCPAGICRRPAGHAGPHSDLPREGER